MQRKLPTWLDDEAIVKINGWTQTAEGIAQAYRRIGLGFVRSNTKTGASLDVDARCDAKCSYCIAEGELITLADGTRIPIEQVKDGQAVMCVDEKSMEQTQSVVVATANRRASQVMILQLEDGRVLKATPDHQILTRRGWVKLEDLSPDDEVLCDNDGK